MTTLSSHPSHSSHFLSSEAISDIVRSALTGFISTLQSKYEVKVSDDMWSTSVVGSTSGSKCTAILQSGVNKGKPCGKSCTGGKTLCSVHAKKTGVVTTPVKTSTPTLVTRAIFHKSLFGNFVFEGFVFDKVHKGICGKEAPDGAIVPLSSEDVIRVRALKLNVVGLSASSSPVSLDKDDSLDIPVEEVKEEIEEEVEEVTLD